MCCSIYLPWSASVVFALLCHCPSLSATSRVPGSYPCHLGSRSFAGRGQSSEGLFARLFVEFVGGVLEPTLILKVPLRSG